MCRGSEFLRRLICAITGLILFAMCVVWSDQVRVSLSTIPRKLNAFTLEISILLIFSDNLLIRLMSLFLVWKTISLVFFMFSESLLIFSHSCISASSLFILFDIIFMSSFDFGSFMWKFVMVPIRLVSSAKSTAWKRRDAFEMSFMYIRNSNGPSTEPCGTPVSSDKSLETESLYLTH